MKKNSFIQGTIIASVSIIIVKLLGALYVIPFYKIIGEQGGTLYSYAYNIYNLFLNISTAGIPLAISMLISEFNTLKKFDAKERTYKIGKNLILIFSSICFIVIFLFSKQIAFFLTSGLTGNNTLDDISLCIKAISLCLLVTPLLSVLRGYFQGHKYITPTSISQVIEQIIRIIIVLLGSYISLNVLHTKLSIGVSISLLGAFFGALFSFIYLKLKAKKNKELFNEVKEKDEITNKEIFKRIISYCIPIILVAVVQNIYDTVDLKLIIKGLNMIGYDKSEVEIIGSVIVTWGPKICMIIVAISMGLSTSLIPHMVSNYVENDMKEVNRKFNQSISTMIITTLPMAIAIIFLSKEVYYLFYGESLYGGLVLKYLAVVNIFLGILTVINTALQGMKKFKIIYINTITGLVINALLDIPLVLLFNKIGLTPYVATIIATIIGCITSYIVVLIYLNRSLEFNYKLVVKTLKKLLVPSISMCVVLFVLKHFITLKLNYINAIITIFFFGVISFAVYLYLSYKNGILQEVLSKEYINRILKKLRLKKG